MKKLTNEKLAFEEEYKTFKTKAFWGDKSDALIEITKKGIIIPLNKIKELKKEIDKACGECDNSVKEKT